MKEKRETTKITTPDGLEITIIAKQHDINALKEELDYWKEEYAEFPVIPEYIRMIHVQALYDEARGDLVGTADGLKNRLDIDYDVVFPEHDDFMDPYQLEYRRAAAYLSGLYLKLGRIEDALDWGEASFETAHDNFYGTEEIAYAMPTYANCFMAAVLALVIGVNGVMLAPMGIYALALMMLIFSGLCGVLRIGGATWWIILCGALLFTFSDSLIAVRHFGTLSPFMDGFGVMSTYLLAQSLLAIGGVRL